MAQFPDKFYADPLGLDRYVVQEKVLYEWRAPNKVKRIYSRQELAQWAAGAVLVAFILLLAHEVFLIFVLLAFLFFFVLYEKSPPIFFECKVTTLGIKIEEKYYYWPQISQFWFEERQGKVLLYLRIIYPTIQYCKLIIPELDQDTIKTTLGTYILYKVPQWTRRDKVLKQLTQQVPFEFGF